MVDSSQLTQGGSKVKRSINYRGSGLYRTTILTRISEQPDLRKGILIAIKKKTLGGFVSL